MVDGAYSWPITSNWCWGLKWLELYHLPSWQAQGQPHLFFMTMLASQAVQCPNHQMVSKWWTVKYKNVSTCGLFWGTVLTNAWRDLWKRQSSGRPAGLQIWTHNLMRGGVNWKVLCLNPEDSWTLLFSGYQHITVSHALKCKTEISINSLGILQSTGHW